MLVSVELGTENTKTFIKNIFFKKRREQFFALNRTLPEDSLLPSQIRFENDNIQQLSLNFIINNNCLIICKKY